jgi:hypothetical protein
MLTLFSAPKPFDGEIGEIQRRAVESWRELDVQVVLLGDEAGTTDAARELDSAFALADGAARFPLRAFVNTDIVLGVDLLAATQVVASEADRFLLVGESFEDGRRRGAAAMDWFVFPAGLFGEIPPFAIGRACFDNWLIWKGRQVGIVVDGTFDVHAVHQAHGYGHVAGGMDEAYYGEEAERNLVLAGGKGHLYTLHDASHVLRGGRLRRNLGAPLRWRETLRKAAWKVGKR